MVKDNLLQPKRPPLAKQPDADENCKGNNLQM